jgi:TonB family C-terminal domain
MPALPGAEPAEAGSVRRWGLCLAAMACLHGAVLTVAMNGATASFPPAPPQAAITLDLAPLQPPPAPKAKPEAKQKPRQPVDNVAVKPAKPKPLPKQAVSKPAESAAFSVPAVQPSQQTETPAEETVHEAPPMPVRSVAVPTWQGELLAHLEQFKRYPRSARMRREEGMAVVRFVVDREGRVVSVRLERTSGADALDEESLALVDRAQPLPPPPDEVAGNRIEVVVPVQFQLR